MLTYPKSIMRVRRMPMHLSSGHVTLMPGKFSPLPLYPPPNFPESDLGRRADSRWALPQISSFFSEHEISEMRWPTGLKFCTMVSTRPNFIMPVQNFGGHTPKKNSEAKNMQNLARFRTTSKFGGKYLRNGWRYSKSDSHSVYGDFSCVSRNKYGEVWSSDLGDLDVKSYPPKAHFSENHISAPRGCCAPKFLHALESDPSLTSAPPTWDGAPFTSFF